MKLLKPKRLFLGVATLICLFDFKPYYGFNLSGLKDWQAELFLKAGRNMGAYTFRDDSSKNVALIGKLNKKNFPKLENGERYLASAEPHSNYPKICNREVSFYVCNVLGFSSYKVTFDETEKWIDCDKKRWGEDFYNISKHEWGHVLDRGHSKDEKDIMHRMPKQRC